MNQKHVCIVLVPVIVGIMGCDQILNSNSDRESDTYTEQQKIYEILIDSLWSRGDSIVVNKQTQWWKSVDPYKNSFDSIGENVWENYLEKNSAGSIQISPINARRATVFLLPDSQIGHWKELYPDAYVLLSFSQVGFNTDKTEALIYASAVYGLLAGGGYMIGLHKKQNGWVIIKQRLIWIS